uniref:Phosphate-repressible acid phosphatase n=1 Tax=Aspergillus niger TaxID=5061 RepID=PPA1_ASPNG|nr:RecName: Full=Phosphate-repressible acid phosphatase; AltName: Full=Acid phosphatase PII; Flags: Precursor [Aspergillus niger]AAA32700.1 acid phosphatase [Aspergillus niger]
MKGTAASALLIALSATAAQARPVVDERFPYTGPAVPIGDWVDPTINGNGKGFPRLVEPPAVKPATANPRNNVNVISLSYIPKGMHIHYQTPFGLGQLPAVRWGKDPRNLKQHGAGLLSHFQDWSSGRSPGIVQRRRAERHGLHQRSRNTQAAGQGCPMRELPFAWPTEVTISYADELGIILVPTTGRSATTAPVLLFRVAYSGRVQEALARGEIPDQGEVVANRRRNFTAYQHPFRMPGPETGGVGNFWYSFDYGLAHFVSIDGETDFANSPEWNFAEDVTGNETLPSEAETFITDSGPFGNVNGSVHETKSYEQWHLAEAGSGEGRPQQDPVGLRHEPPPYVQFRLFLYQLHVREAFEGLLLSMAWMLTSLGDVCPFFKLVHHPLTLSSATSTGTSSLSSRATAPSILPPCEQQHLLCPQRQVHHPHHQRHGRQH